MRPFGMTIGIGEARRRMHDAIVAVSRTERIALDTAAGRVLAAAVTSAADVPPFDRALMDGFAVRASDASDATHAAPAQLVWRGVLYTGAAPSTEVAPGTCIEISTGAVIPDGADAVVMVEHTSRAGDSVLVHHPIASGQNIGRRGGDLTTGDVVCDAGMVLTPARVGALAACGVTAVDVRARPLVAIASTGNEVIAPGTTLRPGQIHDINRFTLPPIVAAHGGVARVHDTVRDDLAALHAFFDAAGDADIVVVSGGSSVGERDLLVDVLRARGEVVFHGIAVKPGKPTLLARVGAALVLGLPGNPTSCLSNAYILLIPMLRAMAGLPAWQPQTMPATLSRDVANTSARHTFLSVRIEGHAAVPAFKGSGEITSLSRADGYIEIPADVTRLDAGSQVEVTLF